MCQNEMFGTLTPKLNCVFNLNSIVFLTYIHIEMKFVFIYAMKC